MFLSLIFLFLFLILTWHIRKPPYFSWDLRFTRKLQSIKSLPLKHLLDLISWVGYPPQGIIFLLCSLIGLYLAGLKHASLIGLVSFTLCFSTVQLLQQIIGRKRPSANLVSVTRSSSSGSFPSSHTAMFVLVLGYFILLSSKYLTPSLLSTILIIAFSGLILLVGPSRIFRGEHWTSDVLGGYIFGFFWLFLTLFLS